MDVRFRALHRRAPVPISNQPGNHRAFSGISPVERGQTGDFGQPSAFGIGIGLTAHGTPLSLSNIAVDFLPPSLSSAPNGDKWC
ncbi:hypothetical protein AB0A63_17470 [Lentzea sp. NPDC042327]|uniref:hypothetical protein n=1 Tax=Lentzea sp. NPDC042327 TaxID=3154801 RepID=UPI0034047160